MWRKLWKKATKKQNKKAYWMLTELFDWPWDYTFQI